MNGDENIGDSSSNANETGHTNDDESGYMIGGGSHRNDDEWVPETADEKRVLDQLRTVLDPCSCFTDEPVNIVDLGLIEDVAVVDGTARIELLLTSPGCTYLPYIERDVEEQIGSLLGIHDVEVEQTTDRVWTRERMADEVRADRRERFRARMEAAGITPYAERTE